MEQDGEGWGTTMTETPCMMIGGHWNGQTRFMSDDYNVLAVPRDPYDPGRWDAYARGGPDCFAWVGLARSQPEALDIARVAREAIP